MQKVNGTFKVLGRQLTLDQYRMAKNAIKILYESNLSKFSFLEDNRKIDENHVSRLVTSIEKYGQMMPIIVDPQLQVIEGQHRLEACKKLKISVAYIIKQDATSKDIAIINNMQKGWGNKDYLNHFSHKNHPNHLTYIKIVKFFEVYPIQFSVGLMLLSGSNGLETGKDRGPFPSFRDGLFKIVNLEEAERKGAQLSKLKGIVPHLTQIRKFCIAFLRVSTLDGFSIYTCYKQMEKYHSRFGHPGNQEEWTDKFVSVYNHKLSAEKKLSVRKI